MKQRSFSNILWYVVTMARRVRGKPGLNTKMLLLAFSVWLRVESTGRGSCCKKEAGSALWLASSSSSSSSCSSSSSSSSSSSPSSSSSWTCMICLGCSLARKRKLWHDRLRWALCHFAKRPTINQQQMVIFYGVILYGLVIMTSNGIQLTTNQMIFGSQNDGLSQSTLSSPAGRWEFPWDFRVSWQLKWRNHAVPGTDFLLF